MTTLHKVAEELHKLAKYIDDVLPVQLRDTEIKSFFVLRHQNMPTLAKYQQYVIKQWEPRVTELLNTLDNNGTEPFDGRMAEYDKLRTFFFANKANKFDEVPKMKTEDMLSQRKSVFVPGDEEFWDDDDYDEEN